MKSIKISILIVVFGMFWFTVNAQSILPVKKIDELAYRLLYLRPDFRSESQLKDNIALLERAANVCYSGVVVQDNRFGYLDRLDSSYFKKLDSFLIHAKSLGLDVFPQAATFVGHQLLVHNPNLAEGLPVKNAPFKVVLKNGEKVLIPNDIFPLLNGDFESVTDGKYFDNWNIHSDSLNISVDKSENNTSVLFQRENDPDGQLKIQQAVQVIPFRNYHLSLKLKVDSFSNINGAGVSIYDISGNKRTLNRNSLIQSCNEESIVSCQLLPLDSVKNNTWVKYDFTFNTLESTELIIALGSWGGGEGKLWWDDLKIEPAGFNNILRRDDKSVPVIIKKGKDILDESEYIDTTIIDPLLYGPKGFTLWHQQPVIKVDNSTLQVGDELTVDYFHAGFIHNGISGPSLVHPDILELTNKQLILTDSIWKNQETFKGWFFGHDEIRLHGWENDALGNSLNSPPLNLEHNFNTIYQQAKEIDNKSTIMVWNDMFDPYSNGKTITQLDSVPYFFVNGYWGRDSADTGLPNDVIIVNWNYKDSIRMKSAEFFANNQHSQILSGYFDPEPEIEDKYYTDNWLRELEVAKITGIKGIMYTTWENDFSNLEDWALKMWGGCPGECNDYETLSNINEGGEYGANILLTANGTIEASDTVHLVSPKKIKLEAGFKFSSDGSNTNIFKAYSGNCPP